MSRKNLLFGSALAAVMAFAACGEGDTNNNSRPSAAPAPGDDTRGARTETGAEARGADREMVDMGRNIVEAECQRCHSADAQSGAASFKHLAERRDQQWIVDFVQNKDPQGQDVPEELEECEVRQPGNALDQEEARQVAAYVRTL